MMKPKPGSGLPVSSTLRRHVPTSRVSKPLQRRMWAAGRKDLIKAQQLAIEDALQPPPPLHMVAANNSSSSNRMTNVMMSNRMIESHKAASERDVRIAAVADALFSRGARHETTFTNIGFLPMGNPSIPEVAFAGRSRCGITSLLRSLFKDRRAVDRGNAAARRDGINAYTVGGAGCTAGDFGGGFTVLETPGFGSRTVPWSIVLQHCSLLRSFCAARPSLKMLYYVMDVSEAHGLAYRDMDTLKFLAEEIKNFTIVLSKTDRNHDMNSVREQLSYHGIEHPVLATSAWTLGGIDMLRFDMAENVLHSLPTEKLSMREVRRLGERLVSLNQVAMGVAPPRLLHRPITTLDEAVIAEKRTERINQLSPPPDLGVAAGTSRNASSSSESPPPPPSSSASPSSSSVVLQRGATTTALSSPLGRPSVAFLSLITRSRLPRWLGDSSGSGTENSSAVSLKYSSKFLRAPSDSYVKYVAQTAPLRNPYLWPAHVALTANKRINVVKVPEDPANPYLFQPQFVVPRADWSFRRPSLALRKFSDNKGRGMYVAAGEDKLLTKRYTLPFFPDIVDIRMNPQAVAFVGAATYYDRGPLGRKLALRSRNAALMPLVDVTKPVANNNTIGAGEEDGLVAMLAAQPGVKKLGPGLAQALRQLDAQKKQKTIADAQLIASSSSSSSSPKLPPPEETNDVAKVFAHASF